MIDKVLAQYLLTSQIIDGVTYNLATNLSNQIFRARPPQGGPRPYLFIGQGEDTDFGPYIGGYTTREVATYRAYLCGDPLGGWEALDTTAPIVEKYLKQVRNMYLPTAIATPKQWVQCIILSDRIQLEGRIVDGDQSPVVCYCYPFRIAYDP